MTQLNLMTTSEQTFADWLDSRGISYNFESELLGGRIELGFIPASFIIGSSIVRFREYLEGEFEKMLLESRGYKVVDITMNEQNEERFQEVLNEVRG